ncbi:MAG: heterodisulfide reductase-related iron-sulfur binding cluster [Dehalococcoidia bacterium]|mgnify:FL=1|nr:heterodisulfide reductase-related iron-sulfur binding cluster [Dehalococcoidia bacterium]
MPLWIGVLGLLGIALAVFHYAFYVRVVKLVLQGKETARFDQPLVRLKGALLISLGQQKVLQRVKYGDYAGIGHAIIFWGFLTFMLSYGIFIFAASVNAGFPEWLLTETGVRVYSAYLDILSAVMLVVLIWAFVRRWVVKPSRLRFDLTRHSDALIIVVLITGLMASTLLTHAFWVAQGGTGPEADVYIGKWLGELFIDWGVGASAANFWQGFFWWSHLSIILIFTVYIPFTKHMHMFAAPVNAYFRSLEPKGALPLMDLENTEKFGAGRVQDFSWKQLLDGYACAVCGRCTDVCPANLTGKQLSPMHIVEGIKDHMVAIGHQGERNVDLVEPSPLVPSIISESSIWDCLNCGACMEECPVTVEHVPTIMDMRRHLVLEESKAPESAMNALLSLEQRGHPWRGTQYSRTDWAEGLEVPTLAEKPDAEVLFWVGCTPALEQRSQAIARSMAKVLKAAKVDFAILGDEETCTGDPARRMGNEYLFQILAQQNIDTMNGYNVKKVVTTCPHCFNTMKNEYPQLGGNFEVLHYSQFVDRLIKNGDIKPVKMLDVTMAYHDSCFLGRHNGVYDEPRDVAKAIPGLKLVEMGSRCRERGFCCGAGGGHMWIEESQGDRVNHARTDQFIDTDADMVGVSCPFCVQMLDEGIQAKGLASEKQAKDVIELLADSLDL